MIGSLSRNLMKKAVQIAGNGTKPVTLTIVGPATYDPVTGEHTRTDITVAIGRAILGKVSEAEVAKFKLTTTSHSATVAMLDYEAAGSPTLPDTNDRILIDGIAWMIEKIVYGSMNQSIKFYVCEA
jgi:hypothetical protein